MASVRVVFLGDSDISRWPPSHYPSSVVNNNAAAAVTTITCVNNLAKGGAVMSDLLTQLKEWREDDNNISVESNNTIIFVACAGENDVSSGQSIDKIQHSFTHFIEKLFRVNHATDEPSNINNKHLIFFGPKFEPWLTNDHASRKQYKKLSTALQRTIRKSPVVSSSLYSQNIVYVDCLTMFCTSATKDVPGAVHGGRAIPDRRYFDSDELHLSGLGYDIWKEILDEKIQSIMHAA